MEFAVTSKALLREVATLNAVKCSRNYNRLWELATPYAKRNQLKYKRVILLGAGYAVHGER